MTNMSCCEQDKKQSPSCHVEQASSSCAASQPAEPPCCEPTQQARMDKMLWFSLFFVVLGYLAHVSGLSQRGPAWLMHFAHGTFELANAMWLGLLLGVIFVGLLAHVPRETVMRMLGGGGTWRGLIRATAAGVLLDLCSHGILAVGMKLYERGASLGQVMAFLIASPWNSLSLTLILIGLIGFSWTFVFIGLSFLIALLTGRCFDRLVASGRLPGNILAEGLVDAAEAPSLLMLLRSARPTWGGLGAVLATGLRDARIVIRWALFGLVLAALIRALVPADIFAQWMGPTAIGLAITLVAATVIEVCSEGSTPIAADIFNRAYAPGNAFTFLMAGVATDYTEIMTIKETTKSWKVALFLPLITLPQVVVIGFALNHFFSG